MEMREFEELGPEALHDYKMGEYLRRKRLKEGMTLDQVARLTEIRAQRLRLLEEGEVIHGATPRELAALCRVYRLDTKEAKRISSGELSQVQSISAGKA